MEVIMARLPRGQEVLEKAETLMSKVKDIDELRMLQAVVFPLANGMSIEETAKAIGRGVVWTVTARNKFIRNKGIPEKPINVIRNRAHMTKDDEVAFLQPFIESAKQGGILLVSVIHQALEKRLGSKVALATAYNLLYRNGWRKLAPDKRNVAVDIQAQEDFKKNYQKPLPKSKTNGKEKGR
jgi:transposase